MVLGHYRCKKQWKDVPMAQMTNNHCLGQFLSPLHAVGVGRVAKPPLSYVLSEGGRRGVVGRKDPFNSRLERGRSV